ncbi:MAG: hypothetical protein ABSH51_30995 [Solirubrobacteraceae bacterium]|jgi:hypothetical protein
MSHTNNRLHRLVTRPVWLAPALAIAALVPAAPASAHATVHRAGATTTLSAASARHQPGASFLEHGRKVGITAS